VSESENVLLVSSAAETNFPGILFVNSIRFARSCRERNMYISYDMLSTQNASSRMFAHWNLELTNHRGYEMDGVG